MKMYPLRISVICGKFSAFFCGPKMANLNSTAGSKSTDVLDEEFQNFLDIAQGYAKDLVRKEDKAICAKYLKRLCELKSTRLPVKVNRNRFFKYFLKMLEVAHSNQIRLDMLDEPVQFTASEKHTAQFSDDNRTYVSVKHISGYGTLVYMAMNDDEDARWERLPFTDVKFS